MREHLELVARTWGADRTAARTATEQLLSELALTRLAERFPHQLSAGQAQLCSLALTLARPCEVLLLDEPEQRLGVVTQALRRRQVAGTTLLLATHSRGLVEALADDELLLEEAA